MLNLRLLRSLESSNDPSHRSNLIQAFDVMAEVKPIKCFIRADDSAIDLLANIGWHTTLHSRLLGERGKVYAGESIRESISLLLPVEGFPEIQTVRYV